MTFNEWWTIHAPKDEWVNANTFNLIKSAWVASRKEFIKQQLVELKKENEKLKSTIAGLTAAADSLYYDLMYYQDKGV